MRENVVAEELGSCLPWGHEELVPRHPSSVKYEEPRVTILEALDLCDLPPPDFGEQVSGLQGKEDLCQAVAGLRKAQDFQILEDADRGLRGFNQGPTVFSDLWKPGPAMKCWYLHQH